MTTITATPARARSQAKIIPTIVRVIEAIYCLIPVAWVFTASSKTRFQLFSTFSLIPGTGFLDYLRNLSSYDGGVFWHWTLNSLIYAGGGALVSTIVSAAGMA